MTASVNLGVLRWLFSANGDPIGLRHQDGRQWYVSFVAGVTLPPPVIPAPPTYPPPPAPAPPPAPVGVPTGLNLRG